MEANDNNPRPGFDARKALLMRLVENLCPGADGRAGIGAIYRELEHIRPGSLDQAHARDIARRLNLSPIGERDEGLPNLSCLDFAEPAPAG